MKLVSFSFPLVETPEQQEVTLTGHLGYFSVKIKIINDIPLFLAGELSQLQPLMEYQQRMLQDLTDSAKRYREVLKANEVLERKLENANKDLEFEKAKRKHCENR